MTTWCAGPLHRSSSEFRFDWKKSDHSQSNKEQTWKRRKLPSTRSIRSIAIILIRHPSWLWYIPLCVLRLAPCSALRISMLRTAAGYRCSPRAIICMILAVAAASVFLSAHRLFGLRVRVIVDFESPDGKEAAHVLAPHASREQHSDTCLSP